MSVVIIISVIPSTVPNQTGYKPGLTVKTKIEHKPNIQDKPKIQTEPNTQVTPKIAAPKIHNWQTFTVTAYTLRYQECGKRPGHPDYGVTASGVKAKVGITIAAGGGIPFGTKIYIPDLSWINGTGIFVVQDRGGGVGRNCIDVFFGDPEVDPGCVKRACDFGRRKMKGEVL
jgi:3D (Asp-Asp-Asp) domain-containing protein